MKLFKTFFIGGYECADMINNRGNRVDLLTETGHSQQVAEDYKLLGQAGIKTVREGIRWTFVEKQPYQYDFSEVKNRLIAAQEAGVQQLWDICHFGYPDGLMPSHPQFADRFVAVCKAFVALYRSYTNDPLIIAPINEISFISWLGGEVRGTIPFAINSGFDVKYFLCLAAIKGIEAIKQVDPTAKIMMAEPLIKVHSKAEQPISEVIEGMNEAQFQAMDIVTGRMCPELGGKPEYLDVAGFNFYYDNQWEHEGPVLPWDKDNRRCSFVSMLKEAARRYNKPVLLSETGHFGEDQVKWMQQITDDCLEALNDGVDLQGVCIYPVLDRPDWDHFNYIPCGIWGYNTDKKRFAKEEYLVTVQQCAEKVNRYLAQKEKAAPREKALAFT